jgi:hypothetical protein
MQVENLHERMSGVEQMIQAYGKELLFRAPWKEQ